MESLATILGLQLQAFCFRDGIYAIYIYIHVTSPCRAASPPRAYIESLHVGGGVPCDGGVVVIDLRAEGGSSKQHPLGPPLVA